ncbi:hypothetical protein [Devosia sp.]|jgi:hypothetical protein|uniref:hypothetical protein n=1 Tax=Devosia sp. TaxID=1871048 RepID=UPI0037C0E3D6
MRLAIIGTLAAMLTATAVAPAWAQVNADESFVVVGYMRSYGCSLNAAQVDLFLPDMKLDVPTYQKVLDDLVERGFAIGDSQNLDGGVVLKPAFCGVEKGNDPRLSLIEIMRYNGCRLTQADPPKHLMPVGFMPDSFRPLVQELITAGDLAPEGSDLVLSAALCAGPNA